ncbi:MAG: 6-phosphofructokinase [archaeon]
MRTIGILTGGGDVAGLNAVIRDITFGLLDSGREFNVVGIRRGWGGLVYMDPNDNTNISKHIMVLDKSNTRKIDRDGGTILHTSRVSPLHVKNHPNLLRFRGIALEDKIDMNMTSDLIHNLENLGIDTLVVIGGDDTLSYARYLYKMGFKIIGVPKTMDGDVNGTDYCIGFSSAISRAKKDFKSLRTAFGSQEGIGVVEIFGRDSGFSALYTAYVAKPDRLIIPEVPFDIERLAEFLVKDRMDSPSEYSCVIISEGSTIIGQGQVFISNIQDGFGHPKLGGIGDKVAEYIKRTKGIDYISERFRYLLRSGDPDPLDSFAASQYASLAVNAILNNEHGIMTAKRDGKYCSVPLNDSEGTKRVDVPNFYDAENYIPLFNNPQGKSFIL